MDVLYIPPLKLIFMIGIYSFGYDILFIIIYHVIIKNENVFLNIILMIDNKNILYCVIYLVSFFTGTIIYSILSFLTIYYFSPTLLVISDLLSPFLYLIFNIKNNDKNNLILSISGYSVAIIASIFYNELIVCNFWGLNKNIVVNIQSRGQDETYLIENDDNKSEKSDINCDVNENGENNKKNENIEME